MNKSDRKKDMMKILVTGFNPFGKETINPSIEAVKRLPNKIANAELIKLEIPTVMNTSLETIEEVMLKENPDMILSIGQAGGRSDISIERVGININDFSIPDNHGNQPIDELIYEDGATAYFTNLPIKAMVDAIREEGIRASVSNSAGTFVCNHVMYGVRYMVEHQYQGKKSGFIHIPYLPEQVRDKPGQPCMELDLIVKGLCKAIETMVLVETDLKIIGGSIN